MTSYNATDRLDALLQEEATRDTMIITLVSEGNMTLNAATREYGKWAKANGMITTKVSHKGSVMDIWRDEYPDGNGWDSMAVKDEAVEMAAKFDIAESTVRDYAKAYSEELGVDYPVTNPRTAMFQWLKDHDGDEVKQMKTDFVEYAEEELGRSRSNINEYWKGYELHLYLSA